MGDVGDVRRIEANRLHLPHCPFIVGEVGDALQERIEGLEGEG